MPEKRFLSIKWKFAFLISAALILLQSYMTYRTYVNTTESFLHQGAKAQARYSHIAEATLKNSSKVLELFAESIFLGKQSAGTGTHPHDQTIVLLDKNWSDWQFAWGLESAVLTDDQGETVKTWGGAPTNLNVQEQVQRVLLEEKPLNKIFCGDKCYIAITIPIISSFKAVGTLSLSRSLADGMIEYREATDTDIVILTQPGEVDRPQDHSHKISAMTQATRNNPLLHEFRQQNSFKDIIHKNIIFPYNNGIYNIQAHHMGNLDDDQSSLILIVDEITSEYKEMSKQLLDTVFSNMLGLLIILMILFFLLHNLLKRLAGLSSGLPLLVQHEYKKVRRVLSVKEGFHLGYDEIDNLVATAREVGDQLEQLTNETQKKTLLLTKKSQALRKEKDFVQKLVQTAPILIITQTCTGEILSINNEGLNLYGADQDELIGKSFDDFFAAKEPHNQNSLTTLRKSSNTKTTQYDCEMLSFSGSTHSVSWLHSILYPKGEEYPIILTIGLDITHRKRAEDQMVWLATHDHLTSLSNLRHFNQEFDKIINLSKRYDQQVALLYMDLDQFKIINDTQGHHKGDLVLQAVADTLLDMTRKSDLICRIGGDEFTLLIPNATDAGVVSLAKKINEVLGKVSVKGIDHNFKISASIGIVFCPRHGSCVNDLLSNADLAMYHAKESGYGQFHIFSHKQQYQEHLTQKMHWKNIIEEAIAKNRFVLYFQPILNLKKNRISHYECLIRMVSENGTIILPGKFIEHAEDLNLIGQIDKLVLEKAIGQHLEFNKNKTTPGLSINLSGQSLNDESIYRHIKRLLTLPGVNPEKIIFEVTETSAISNFSSAQNLINEVKKLGCQFAIDDFGVGFSSFRYLKNLAVDYIKIDGTFIKKIDQNYEDKIFVKSLSEIAHALGKKTIAEFVENEAIMSILREYDIDFVQGYHIGKPQPLENIQIEYKAE